MAPFKSEDINNFVSLDYNLEVPIEQLWWLSFVDNNLPKGTQFLGVVIVNAIDFLGAVSKAHHLNINPGGEVVGVPIPMKMKIDKSYINCFLSRQECERDLKEFEIPSSALYKYQS
jgi:hypothetical protein